MELFDPSGHLTDHALLALVQNEEFDELARLELAEHLSYCDRCLQRYTALLADAPLLAPAHSCRESLWRRVRSRTLRLLTSRYATAAAAVALALTVLWGSAAVSIPQRRPALPEVHQQLQRWPERWSDSLDGALSRFNNMFDDLGGTDIRSAQGGNS